MKTYCAGNVCVCVVVLMQRGALYKGSDMCPLSFHKVIFILYIKPGIDGN